MDMEVIQKIKKVNKSYIFKIVKVHYNNALSSRHKHNIFSLYNEHDKQIGHCLNVKMEDISFEINEKLKQECLKTGAVNFHASARGKLLEYNEFYLDEIHSYYNEIKYNPFSCLGFFCKKSKIEIKKSKNLVLNKNGFFIF